MGRGNRKRRKRTVSSIPGKSEGEDEGGEGDEGPEGDLALQGGVGGIGFDEFGFGAEIEEFGEFGGVNTGFGFGGVTLLHCQLLPGEGFDADGKVVAADDLGVGGFDVAADVDAADLAAGDVLVAAGREGTQANRYGLRGYGGDAGVGEYRRRPVEAYGEYRQRQTVFQRGRTGAVEKNDKEHEDNVRNGDGGQTTRCPTALVNER